MEMAIKSAKAAMFMYCDKDEDNDTEFDNYKDEGGQSYADFEQYNPEQFGWKEVPAEFAESIAEKSEVEYQKYVMLNEDGSVYAEHNYFYDKSTGFKAGLYETPDGDYVLVSRGTHNSEEIPSKRDWIDDNIKQGLFGRSDQYDQEARVSAAIREKINMENEANGTNSKFITAGHSLGGGTATLGAAVGRADESYVFNAAGVNNRMFDRHESTRADAAHVYSFSSDYDPLTMLNDNVWLAPGTAGKRIVLEVESTSIIKIGKWLTNGHDLPYLLKAMKAVPVAKVYALKQ